MKIGEKIRNLRIKEQWTQKELAVRLGVAHNTVSDYERNTKAVALDKIEKLCEIFDVEMNYFLEKEDVSIATSNKMIVEDLLDTLISRGTITDPNNIDKSTIDMLVQVMKKDIEDKLKKQH